MRRLPSTVFLDRPGGRIAYDVAGEGPLVICAPGMGDVRSVYRFLAPALVDAGERLGGEVMIVPEAGHYPQAEYPEIVGPAVARFLARVHE